MRARREQVSLRISAGVVFELARLGECVKEARKGDSLVYSDGAFEKSGERLLLGNVKELVELLDTCGLAPSDTKELTALAQRLEEHYLKTPTAGLRENDRRELYLIAGRIGEALRKRFLGADFVDESPQEGTLDYHDLMYRGVKHFFGDDTGLLPLVVWHDLEEAINGLCFGAPTAAVVIALRAVEEMLRDLHAGTVGEPWHMNWEQIVQSLTEKLAEDARAARLLQVLGTLHEARKEAAYSERIYGLEQAEGLFSLAVIAIREARGIKASLLAGAAEQQPEAPQEAPGP